MTGRRLNEVSRKTAFVLLHNHELCDTYVIIIAFLSELLYSGREVEDVTILQAKDDKENNMHIRLSELLGEIVAALVILAFIIGGIILSFYEYRAIAEQPVTPSGADQIIEAQVVDLNSNN